MSAELDELLRIEGGRVVATLIRMTGDFDLAEDAVQDALVAAVETWDRSGVPDNPGAWLTTTARRKALDRIRRESTRRDKEQAAASLLADDQPPERGGSSVDDDMLRLIFTCCHPALALDAQIALTLRTVCGLPTREIASVFLVNEATMGQRISRAKRKIAVARIPYRVPPDHELPDRLRGVIAVVRAVFTAGHHAPGGDVLVRVDLADEAIRLARVLLQLMRDDPEAMGLLALLLATDARRDARLDRNGEVVLIRDQDRTRWNLAAISEAHDLIDTALRRHRPGPVQVQAAISCLHGLAPTWEDTDWPQIVELYRLLERQEPTAVVRVNRAVAEAEVHGAQAGLDLLEDVEGVDQWHLFWSTRADFLRRLDRLDEAIVAYRRALSCEANEADRRFLERRVEEVAALMRPA